MTTPTGHRPRIVQIAQGLVALTVLLLLIAAIPVGLFVVGGSPLPHHLPSPADITARLTQPDTDNTLFLTVVRLIAWGAWTIFAATTTGEAISFIRGHAPRRLPAPIRPFQHLARDLVTTAALILTTAGPITTSTTTTGDNHPAAISGEPVDSRLDGTDHTDSPSHRLALATESKTPTTDVRQAQQRHAWRSYTIKRGDTLWAIARHAYGSGSRYPIIFNASKHLTQPPGLPRITNANLIFPRQHLKIPAADINRSRRPSTPPRQVPRSPHISPPLAPVPIPPDHSGRSTPRPDPSPTASPPESTTPPSRPPRTGMPTPPHPRPTGDRIAPTRPPASGRPARPPTLDNPRHSTTEPPEAAHHDGPTAVMLRTGGYISLGLAAAISIALAATRLHRRRRRTHGQWPPAPDPEPSPPATVAQARKAHLDALTDRGGSPPSDEDLVASDFTAPPPTHLAIGVRDNAEITVELGGLNLALTGPGATDVARAILTELLACSRRSRVELVLPEPDATALLAGTGINGEQLTAAVPGLTVTPSLDAAIAHLEAEFVHRARLMEHLDIPDVPALRTAEPGEPLPAIVLIATVPDHSAHGLEAILQHARPYCVGALLLGTWPPGTTLTVTDDGTITRADGPNPNTWNDAKLFHIAPGETTGLLHVIQTANGAPEPGGTTTPPKPTSATSIDSKPDAIQHTAPPGDDQNEATPDEQTAPVALDRAVRGSSERKPGDLPVHLCLLGAVQVQVGGVPIATGLRRASYDLLAYLALNPDGITREQAIDALWADKPPEMWHTAITNTRKILREATNLREPMFIIRTGNRYRLDTTLIDVDAWRLLDVIRAAQQATNDTERLEYLKQVPDLYTGELATDLTHEWAETHREYLRRHGTNALAYLARLTHDHDSEQALAALEQAITHDPHAEALYRSIMRIQARHHQPDAIRRTYQLLETHLAELDIDPSEETRQLLLTLLRPTATKAHAPRT